MILVSSAYEIDVRSCPLNPNEKKGTINWYKNDSNTPISTERDSRVHQHKDKLWFVPAEVEDSGQYYCAVRYEGTSQGITNVLCVPVMVKDRKILL